LILDTARKHGLSQKDLPAKIVILSDMEFDRCVGVSNNRSGDVNVFDLTAMQAIKAQYAAAGFEVPQVVFWTINARPGNSPVKFNQTGTALISGFSPAIVKSILGGKFLTPIDVMMKTVMSDRYNF